jgi:hypothetical protein
LHSDENPRQQESSPPKPKKASGTVFTWDLLSKQPDELVRRLIRFPKAVFMNLFDYLKPFLECTKPGAQSSVSPIDHLLITLVFLTTGMTYDYLASILGFKATNPAKRVVDRTLDAIVEPLKARFITIFSQETQRHKFLSKLNLLFDRELKELNNQRHKLTPHVRKMLLDVLDNSRARPELMGVTEYRVAGRSVSIDLFRQTCSCADIKKNTTFPVLTFARSL